MHIISINTVIWSDIVLSCYLHETNEDSFRITKLFGKPCDVLTRCSSHPQAKVKWGAKSWCSYRHGYCACASMRFSAEAEVPARLALAWLPCPLVFSWSQSNILVAYSLHLNWVCCLPGSSQCIRLPLPLARQIWRPYPAPWFCPSPLGVVGPTEARLWQTSTCPPCCMYPSVLWLASLSASVFPQRTPYHTGRGSDRLHMPVSPWGGDPSLWRVASGELGLIWRQPVGRTSHMPSWSTHSHRSRMGWLPVVSSHLPGVLRYLVPHSTPLTLENLTIYI